MKRWRIIKTHMGFNFYPIKVPPWRHQSNEYLPTWLQIIRTGTERPDIE